MKKSYKDTALIISIFILMCIVNCMALVSNREKRTLKHRFSENNIEKRPFCNAFTGCGKKRSLPNQERILQNEVQEINSLPSDESIGALLDLNAEPAVEELMRQIMSEAKLWEAVQEAQRAILEKQKHHSAERLPLSFSIQ